MQAVSKFIFGPSQEGKQQTILFEQVLSTELMLTHPLAPYREGEEGAITTTIRAACTR